MSSPAQSATFAGPMAIPRHTSERTTVKSGSVKMSVNASPSGRYARHVKFSSRRRPPNKAWARTKNLKWRRQQTDLIFLTL